MTHGPSATQAQMTDQEAVTFVAKVDVSRFRPEMRVWAEITGKRRLTVFVELTTETKVNMTGRLCLEFSNYLEFKDVDGCGWDEEYLLAFVRRCLRTAVMHELDESIVVRGGQPFDPHAPWRQA